MSLTGTAGPGFVRFGQGARPLLTGEVLWDKSEEGRVGEEGRCRWVPDHLKKKKSINADVVHPYYKHSFYHVGQYMIDCVRNDVSVRSLRRVGKCKIAVPLRRVSFLLAVERFQ